MPSYPRNYSANGTKKCVPFLAVANTSWLRYANGFSDAKLKNALFELPGQQKGAGLIDMLPL